MSLKVQGQLKGVDWEVCLQLTNETGQRPENQITTLGLVPRRRVESGEQVTGSFNIQEGFFFSIVWYSIPNRRSRFLAGCVWPLKRISMKSARIEIPSQEGNTRTWM